MGDDAEKGAAALQRQKKRHVKAIMSAARVCYILSAPRALRWAASCKPAADVIGARVCPLAHHHRLSQRKYPAALIGMAKLMVIFVALSSRIYRVKYRRLAGSNAGQA